KMTKSIFNGKEKVTVAIAQASPVFMNKDATIQKAIKWINKASKKGADMVVFPESYIPAFPYWQQGGNDPVEEWDEVHSSYQDEAVVVGTKDTIRLSEAAKKARIHVVMGCTELDDAVGSRT